MIYNLYDSQSEAAARCLALIERHAPTMMLAGQGPLSQEITHNRLGSLTRDVRRRMVSLRRAGNTLQEIAEATGYTYPTVAKVCREAGLPSVRKAGRVRSWQVARIHQMRAEKRTVRAIAAELRLSVSCVQRWATAA